LCATPTTTTVVSQPVTFTGGNGQLIDVNFPFAATYPKHANRLEPGNKFTTFMVYEDCKELFVQGHGSPNACLNAQVLITRSTDNGTTWLSPASVDAADGHHFFRPLPPIAPPARSALCTTARKAIRLSTTFVSFLNRSRPSTPKLAIALPAIQDSKSSSGKMSRGTALAPGRKLALRAV
jgi:hypothetical protein